MGKKDVQKFVVVANARSGSNFLVGKLKSHPQICTYFEIFNRVRVFGPPHVQGKSEAYRFGSPIQFIEEVFELDYPNPDYTHFGYKILANDTPGILKVILEDPSYKVIILDRKDRLAQYSSRKISLETNQWLCFDKKDCTTHKVKFDFSEYVTFLVKYIVCLSHFERQLKKQGRPYVKTSYEAVMKPNGMDKILTYLGVDETVPLQIHSFRQNTKKVCQRFVTPWRVCLASPFYRYIVPVALRWHCFFKYKDIDSLLD